MNSEKDKIMENLKKATKWKNITSFVEYVSSSDYSGYLIDDIFIEDKTNQNNKINIWIVDNYKNFMLKNEHYEFDEKELEPYFSALFKKEKDGKIFYKIPYKPKDI